MAFADTTGLYDTRGEPLIKQSKRWEDEYEEAMREFSQMTSFRNTFATQWEEVASLIDPTQRNTFFYGNYNWPGQKFTERQVDASGMMALGRFAAICDSLLTPRNSTWHTIGTDNEYLMKQRGVKLYFEQVTRILFKQRYKPLANFSSQNQMVYKGLGAYGTAGLFIDALDGSLFGQRGLRYKNVPVGEIFLRENHQGLVDGFCRWFRLTAYQAWQKWGHMGTFPPTLRPALEQNSQLLYNFIHRVVPRGPHDYDPQHLGPRRFPYKSIYISIEGRQVLGEGGYLSMPMPITRYEQAPNENYGRSPAMAVLPALKTLNAEKATFLRQGHRAADPVLLTADDGVVGMSMRPGAVNKGGVTSEGKELVKILPTGNIQTTETMMGEEKSLINDAFLVSLFQILTETPQMTATEVIERTNEKGILIAPTVGRQQSEYLGPVVEREVDVLNEQQLLPPMPPVLQEARGEYHVVYTSPLSRAAKAQEAAGFMRTLETVKELVNITQDQSLLDPFNFKNATRGIAEIQAVPESWMSSDEEMAQKAKARAQAQEREAQIQEAPAKAAMMKAQAAVAKANGPAGGQMPATGGPPLAQQLGG